MKFPKHPYFLNHMFGMPVYTREMQRHWVLCSPIILQYKTGQMNLTASNFIYFLNCARRLHTFNENVTIINFYLRPGPNVPYIVCSELKSLVRPPTHPTGCCCYAADWVTIGDITSLLTTLRMLSQPNSIRLKLNLWCNLNFYLDLVKCSLKGWFSVYNIVLT